MKLFLLPYAGGSAISYYKWNKYIASAIEVVPVELAGRGKRNKEPFYCNMAHAVEDIYNFVSGNVQDDVYAVFGHSMGGLLAFELYYKLKERKNKLPDHLFFSGCKPPHLLRSNKKNISQLTDEDIKEDLLRMGGTSREVLASKELIDYFFPIIRADFSILESYKYAYKSSMINCDISVLNGEEDSFSEGEINQWEIYAENSCHIHMFNGGHFYINHSIEEICNSINEKLSLFFIRKEVAGNS